MSAHSPWLLSWVLDGDLFYAKSRGLVFLVVLLLSMHKVLYIWWVRMRAQFESFFHLVLHYVFLWMPLFERLRKGLGLDLLVKHLALTLPGHFVSTFTLDRGTWWVLIMVRTNWGQYKMKKFQKSCSHKVADPLGRGQLKQPELDTNYSKSGVLVAVDSSSIQGFQPVEYGKERFQ